MLYCPTTMRYRTISLAALLCLAATSCRNKNPIRLEQTIEESRPLVSAIRFSEQSRTDQLVKGFYDLQAGSWRWTAPQFEVVLAAPPDAKTKGAVLTLEFDLPDPSIAGLKEITITGRANRFALAPETYSTTGQHQYRREIPAADIAAPDVVVNISVDKYLTPPEDGRHLALVVSAIGLEPQK
jgi:hypothetical protein